MRPIYLLLISVALATSAGCFGKDDGGDTTTTPTPTGTTPIGTTPTGTTPVTTTPGGNTTTPPAKPAPREVYSGSATFQPAPPTDPTNPGGAPVSNPMPVPAQYTKLTLNVTWALGQAPLGAVAQDLKVQMVDPTGAAVGSPCTVAAGAVQAPPPVCTVEATIPATGGEYVLQTSGDGTLTATITVVAS